MIGMNSKGEIVAFCPKCLRIHPIGEHLVADFWAQERETKREATRELVEQTGPREKHRVQPAPDVEEMVLSRFQQRYVSIDEVNAQLAEVGESDA